MKKETPEFVSLEAIILAAKNLGYAEGYNNGKEDTKEAIKEVQYLSDSE